MKKRSSSSLAGIPARTVCVACFAIFCFIASLQRYASQDPHRARLGDVQTTLSDDWVESNTAQPSLLALAHGERGNILASRRLMTDRPTPPTSIHTMVQEFELAQGRLYEELQKDYGPDCMTTIFQTSTPFLKSPQSLGTKRLVKKLQLKLLRVLVEGTRQTVVWATGGHSAAAGHGNLYNESYTAVMERNGRDPFASIGLEFTGRNYAMGGTKSGVEVASCTEAIFGTDIDILSWDFGMTDAGDYGLAEYYCVRANRQLNRPACVVWNQGGNNQGLYNVVEKIESEGGTVLYSDNDVVARAESKIPDCADISATQIQGLAPNVKFYRCGRLVEDGPFCKEQKFTNTKIPACEGRKYRVRWHPGWKWHALRGNFMLLALLDLIKEALHEIQSAQSDFVSFMTKLQKEQDEDYAKLQMAPRYATGPWIGSSICRTARLPAESRYLGILTESSQTGMYSYDKGMEFEEAKRISEPHQGKMPLVYSAKERQVCEITLNVDYKDMFLTLGTFNGFTSITVPNEAERRAYLSSPGRNSLVGTIAICFLTCAWGKCPNHEIRLRHLVGGKDAIVQVNGQNVTKFTGWGRSSGDRSGEDCAYLESDAGRNWTSSSGTYTIGVNLIKPANMLRLSSVIVW